MLEPLNAKDLRPDDLRRLLRGAKYHNVRETVDGYTFDSRREARRYRELRLLEASEHIARLEVHPVFGIEVNGMRVCKYIADFSYFSFKRMRVIVEDVKGVRTPSYKLKKKLMLAVRGIVIEEV